MGVGEISPNEVRPLIIIASTWLACIDCGAAIWEECLSFEWIEPISSLIVNLLDVSLEPGEKPHFVTDNGQVSSDKMSSLIKTSGRRRMGVRSQDENLLQVRNPATNREVISIPIL